MDFLKIAYVKGGHWVCFSSSPFSCPSPAFSCHSSYFSCSSSPFSLLLFSPSFHSLPSVPFLLFYTLLCFLLVRILSPYPYHFLLSLLPVLHSITTLSAPHMYHFHSIVLFIFFVSFDISCYKSLLSWSSLLLLSSASSITKLSISWSITMSFRVYSSSTLMTCLQ